jgi:hypothetical protein
MSLFHFPEKTKPEPPEPTLADRVELARLAVKTANELVDDAALGLRQLQEKYTLVIDCFGNITHLELPDGASRVEVEARVKDLT